MDIRRVSRGEAIAAAGGLALLVLMFLPWFGGSLSSGLGAPVKADVRTGWEAFGGLFDFLIAALAATPMAIAGGRVLGKLAPLPLERDRLMMGAGALLFLIVAVRVLDAPDLIDVPIPNLEFDTSRKTAAFLALGAAATIAYGGYLQRASTRSA